MSDEDVGDEAKGSKSECFMTPKLTYSSKEKTNRIDKCSLQFSFLTPCCQTVLYVTYLKSKLQNLRT